jgi:acid phosphatase type 7
MPGHHHGRHARQPPYVAVTRRAGGSGRHLGPHRPAHAGTASPKRAMLVLTCGVVLVGLLVALPDATATTVTARFSPSADAYVSQARPTTNFGSARELLAGGTPKVRRSYLRFEAANLSGPVAKATVRLYSNDTSQTGFEVRAVPDSGWDEQTITYANAPPPGPVVASAPQVAADGFTSVDVTGLVAGEGVVNLAVTTADSRLRLASRESGELAPQLIIEATSTSTSSSSTSSSTSTTQAPTSSSTASTTTTTQDPTTTSTLGPTTTLAPTTTAAGSGSSSSDPTIAAAGDIACDSSTPGATTCHQAATADLLAAGNFSAVLGLGDHQYPSGALGDFNAYYDPTWGRVKAKTYPAPGNHEYQTSGAAGYFAYFGDRAGPTGRGYYSFNVGSWHLISLNSEISTAAGSAQETWLKADLAASSQRCTLAYWHKPLFSSGPHGNNPSVKPLWDVLYAADTEVVLAGHDHDYERFTPQTPSGSADASGGIREFVVGTGGKEHYSISSTKPNSQVHNTDTFGVLQLTLHPDSYDWKFLPEAGKTFTDTGTGSCH